jgi:hypothetical protein
VEQDTGLGRDDFYSEVVGADGDREGVVVEDADIGSGELAFGGDGDHDFSARCA